LPGGSRSPVGSTLDHRQLRLRLPPRRDGERATETASRNIRAEAAATQERFAGQLRRAAEEKRSTADLTTALRNTFGQSPDRAVLDARVDPDRAARLEVVLYGHGEAGGGLSYESVKLTFS
jgi:hypothetical protein